MPVRHASEHVDGVSDCAQGTKPVHKVQPEADKGALSVPCTAHTKAATTPGTSSTRVKNKYTGGGGGGGRRGRPGGARGATLVGVHFLCLLFPHTSVTSRTENRL